MKTKLSKLLLAVATVAFAAALAVPAMALADEAVTSDTELDTAIANGETELTLAEGTYHMPASAKGKTLTINGVDKSTTIIEVVPAGQGEANGQLDYNLDGSTVTFNDVTIKTNSQTYAGFARLTGTYNNCIFDGHYSLQRDSVFADCVFNVSGDQYNIWTWGAPNATFERCTFNSDGKALLLYGQENTHLTVSGCVFNDKGGLTDLKAAIEIGNDYGKSYTLTVTNTTVNGYEINDKGINTGTTLWANKNSMSGESLTVVVDGEQVWPIVVAEIGNKKYGSLQKAVEAAEDGDTVVVVADHELTEVIESSDSNKYDVYVDVQKKVTIDLNGHKITASPAVDGNLGLVAAIYVGADGDLILKDSAGDGELSVAAVKNVYSLITLDSETANLVIESGNYKLDKANSGGSLIYTSLNESVIVKGGTFELGNFDNENGPWMFNVQGAGDHHVIVNGGTFNTEISRQKWANEVLVPETHYTVDNGDGTWTVKEGAALYVTEGILTGPYYVDDWKIGYPSLEAFFAAANASEVDTTDAYDPITLLKDVAISGSISAGKIDQNGKAITLAANAALKSDSELDVGAVPGYYVAIEGDAESGYTYTARPIPYIPPAAPLPETGCTAADACNVFPDFDEDAWYHDYMDWAYENGIITGYDTGLLGPEDHSTRAQVVTVLYRLAGSPNATGEGAWYADAFAWALEAGIVRGYDDDPTKLGENDVITRQQIATIMHRFAVHMGWDVSVGEDTNILSYPDAADVDEYAVAAMQWAVGMGIIGGYGDTGELAPAAGTERCELAAMLFRLNEAYDVL